MRAAVVEEFGQTPHLVEVDKPAPENGKQVARVRAAALKNIERMLVSGEHYGAAHMKMPMTVGARRRRRVRWGAGLHRRDSAGGGDG